MVKPSVKKYSNGGSYTKYMAGLVFMSGDAGSCGKWAVGEALLCY